MSVSEEESTNQSEGDVTNADERLTRAWLGLAGSVALLVATHLLALVIVADGETLLAVAALEGIVGFVVVGGLLAGGEDWTWALAAGVTSAAGATATWLATTQVDLWLVAIGGAAIATIAGYAIHRCELLTMGLLEETL